MEGNEVLNRDRAGRVELKTQGEALQLAPVLCVVGVGEGIGSQIAQAVIDVVNARCSNGLLPGGDDGVTVPFEGGHFVGGEGFTSVLDEVTTGDEVIHRFLGVVGLRRILAATVTLRSVDGVTPVDFGLQVDLAVAIGVVVTFPVFPSTLAGDFVVGVVVEVTSSTEVTESFVPGVSQRTVTLLAVDGIASLQAFAVHIAAQVVVGALAEADGAHEELLKELLEVVTLVVQVHLLYRLFGDGVDGKVTTRGAHLGIARKHLGPNVDEGGRRSGTGPAVKVAFTCGAVGILARLGRLGIPAAVIGLGVVTSQLALQALAADVAPVGLQGRQAECRP